MSKAWPCSRELGDKRGIAIYAQRPGEYGLHTKETTGQPALCMSRAWLYSGRWRTSVDIAVSLMGLGAVAIGVGAAGGAEEERNRTDNLRRSCS